MQETKTLILDSSKAYQKINRIAYQIVENYHNEEKLTFIGISNKGFLLAKRLQHKFSHICDIEVELIALKVNKKNPLNDAISILPEIDFNNKTIILIDDVLNSGRTLMHAASFITTQGVKQLNTIVLIDRRHRKFPIRADWVGLTLSTTLQEHISVEFTENKIEAYLH